MDECTNSCVYASQCCPGYVATDMSSHKGHKTIDEGKCSDLLLMKANKLYTIIV